MSYSHAPVPRGDKLSFREGFTVSGAALTNGPWGIALLGGVVVGGANIVFNLTTFPLWGSIMLGLWTTLVIGSIGAAWKRKAGNRAVAWARQHPFRFAALPAAITGVVTIPATILVAGPFGAVGMAILNGLGTWVLVSLASMIARAREH